MLPPLQTSVFECTIAEAIARHLQIDTCLEDFRQISLRELAGVIDHLVQVYTRWTAGDEGQVVECSRYFANLCFRLSIPMVEAAYALFLIRDELLANFASENDEARSKANRRLTEFFSRVSLDLLERS